MHLLQKIIIAVAVFGSFALATPSQAAERRLAHRYHHHHWYYWHHRHHHHHHHDW